MTPSDYLASEVRAELGRRSWTIRDLAAHMGDDPSLYLWLVRRVGASRFVDLTLEEASQIAAALGWELVDLIDSPRVTVPL